MSHFRKFLQLIFSSMIVLSLAVSVTQPHPVSAQRGDGIKRQVNAESGKVSFIGPESGNSVPASKTLGLATFAHPVDPAMALAKRFAPEFGLKNPERDLSVKKSHQTENGQISVRYQQNHQGIPVIGGELIVSTNANGDLYSMNGEVSPDLSLSTQPTIDSEQAKLTALQAMAKWYQRSTDNFLVTKPELWIYDESLLRSSTRAAELVWRLEVTSVANSLPVRELVLVDAQRGTISLHLNQVDTAWAASSRNPHEQSLSSATLPSAAPSIVKYEDLVVDEARNRLYGADKVGNKIDVLNMSDLSLISSYTLVNGALPISLALSPNGNELAVAQSGLAFVKFINLTNGTSSEIPSALSGSSTKVTDVIYGRAGILYALSSNGVHVINLTVAPHAEDVTQYSSGDGSYEERLGEISADKNTLYYVTGTCCSGYNSLVKYDISAGLSKPTLLQQTHLYGTGYMSGLRLSLINDETLLLTSGVVYSTSNLTPKAKNLQILSPAIAFAGKDFYVTLYDNTSVTADMLYFFDNSSSYMRSSMSTSVIGMPGALAATSNGDTLFVSSTGGMAKFSIGNTPPGSSIDLPESNHQYNDLAIDSTRGLIYGTDTSGRIDVVDMTTAEIVNSYLLPAGANPIGIDLSPNGSELAIALNGLEKILFINPETGATIAEVTPQLDESIYYTNLPFDLIYGRTNRLYSSGNPGSGGIDYVHVINTATHAWVAKSPYPNTIRTETEFLLNQSKSYLYANQTFSPNNLYIYDAQTDNVTKLYQGPHGPVSAPKFTIVPDGSKIFTSVGQVWDSILQSQLGTLEGAPGKLIKYVPNQNLIVLSASSGEGDVLKFISPVDYHLVGTFTPSPTGTINEMEVSADGTKLVININNEIQVLNLDLSLPSSVSVQSGSNQEALPQTQFLLPLKANVQNYLGQPLTGITVTLTAPSSGASGTFASTNTRTSSAITDANGIATSSIFTANSIEGGYAVKAAVSGLAASADFQLFNGNMQEIRTYSAGNSTSLPGTFLCDQTDSNCSSGDNHAKAVHKYAIGTSDFYRTQHLRDSIDNNGMPIISTVHYSSVYSNANWTGSQMIYGDAGGWPLADDVVAHEFTHGVTQYESNLFYYHQSGAINESLSDLWGEYYDQSNGQGSDSVGLKWQVGEDVSGYGAFRSMSNPPSYGDPDKMTSANYYEGEDDNGGVHYNSGINNKAVYLMVDGGTFNGKTVTALGWDKTITIYYEAQTNILISGSDYSDLFYALQQACSNVIGQHGITSADCIEVKDAIDAVEMNAQPAPGFNTDAPFCAAGATPVINFADNLESGTSKWTFTNGPYTRWQYDTPEPFGPYAHSGQHSLYADDYPAVVTDASARLTAFTVPAGAYLHFAHAYDFEAYLPSPGPYYFDGGVLEYSINGGSSWIDAGSLMNFNGYDGPIYAGAGNPLSGRWAFSGSSHGYISTRLNLASLAGKTVTFRWRMGLDEAVPALGWWVDDVKLYTCPAPANVSVLIGGTNMGSYVVQGSTSLKKSYPSIDNGPVKIQSNNGTKIVASERVAYSPDGGTTWTSHSELMGLPANLVHTSYTFPWYNNLSLDSQLRFGNVGNAPTNVTVTIAGVNMGTYHLNLNQSRRVSYPDLDKGPVVIQSSGGVPIIASLRVAYTPDAGTTWTSFSEMMGLPSNRLTSSYTFPWYNNLTLDSQLRFGNVGTSPTNVTVTIGGQVKGTYTLQPNESKRIKYTDVDMGPVKLASSGNVPIIASIRVAYTPDGGITWTDFSEMMGLPTSALSTHYSFPAYNNVNLNSQLRFGNVGTTSTNVIVTINGLVQGAYTLAPNASRRISYPLNSGPVVIQSSGGVPIIASMRVAYTPDGGTTWTSFSEMMGLPQSQLTTAYLFPWYNNVGLDTQLRFGVP